MLIDSAVETAVPADHVNWARDFYADKLGLTPVSEFAGDVEHPRRSGEVPVYSVNARRMGLDIVLATSYAPFSR